MLVMMLKYKTLKGEFMEAVIKIYNNYMNGFIMTDGIQFSNGFKLDKFKCNKDKRQVNVMDRKDHMAMGGVWCTLADLCRPTDHAFF